MALRLERLYTPTFPEFPELATVSKDFCLDDSILEEVKEVIIEERRLQLKQRIGKGSSLTLREEKN